MTSLSIKITRFVDEGFPGVVECTLLDAEGVLHTFIEKVPVVSLESLWWDSDYPRPGVAECVIEAEWTDEQGRALVRVSTEKPCDIESTMGQTIFVVPASQVTR